MNLCFVTNYWGWSLRGLRLWLKYGWGKPISVWGIEISGSSPRRYRRRVKVGPVCFNFGTFAKGRR
jgi:hypothetical protein